MTDDDGAQPTDLNIQEIIRHPDYRLTTKINDIALIRVSTPIQFSENILPACLRTDLSDVGEDIALKVTGWGSTSAESKFVSPKISKNLSFK